MSMYSGLNSVSVGASIPATNDHVEDFHVGDHQKAFQKWPRRDKRKYVERFSIITTPDGQNGKTKNLHFTCKCCGKKFMGQLITAMIHLSGARRAGQRISTCPTPNEDIRAEILQLFTLDQEQVEDLTNDAGGDGMLMSDAFGNSMDLQHQQGAYLHQQQMVPQQPQKRVVTKRKREPTPLSTKAMSVNPSDPTDMAILNFFSQCGVRPEHVEHPAFITMARALRAAPKNYALPVLNRHTSSASSAHSAYAPSNLLNAGSITAGGSSNSSMGGVYGGGLNNNNNAAAVPTYDEHEVHLTVEGDSSDSDDNSTQPETLM